MKDNSVSKAVEPLVAAVGDPEGVKASNESLAVLMSSSSLGEAPPRLESGIVLKDEDHKYWLCIQPLCDSVRLDSSRAFPMLPITVEPAKPAAMIRSIEGDAIGIGFDLEPAQLGHAEVRSLRRWFGNRQRRLPELALRRRGRHRISSDHSAKA